MKTITYDKEILYVQKIYFFLFLWSFTLLASLIIWWKLDIRTALLFMGLGFVISYIVMVLKKGFLPPDRKITAQKMAREISRNTSPLVIARFASQLYFYFNEPRTAVSLLEKYLPSQDPLVCATLGDIFLREKRARQALSILRDNPYALTDPLLLAIQGHALKSMGKLPEAIKMYERSLRIAKQTGFPHNGASRLTQKFLTLSYTASIHHSLGDCYLTLKNLALAKKHYRSGNIRLLDVTMWRFAKSPLSNSPESYTKSH